MQIVFDEYSGKRYCFTHCCEAREMETDAMGCEYRSNGSYIIKVLCDGTGHQAFRLQKCGRFLSASHMTKLEC